MNEIQEIEARLAAATPGPWSRSGYDVGQVVYGPGGQPDLIGPISTNSDIEDAEFIAHAPKDVRALIDEVGRLTVEHLEMRIERDNLRERRDYYRKAVMKADGEIEAVRDAVARHPDVMECSEYSDDEPVSCGWKRAYEDVVWALNGGKE